MAALGVDGRLSGRRLDDSPAGTVVRAGVPEPRGDTRLAGTAGAAGARPSAGAAGVSDLAIWTTLRLDCVATLRQGSMSIPEHGL
jgi:hypothetical protein